MIEISETYVILVDINDNPIGIMEKMKVHREAQLHRAISVFIFNSKGEWLLQRRALTKYHSNGLWTNSCCSHPNPNELTIDAANRRLMEEIGLTCNLKELFGFTYKEVLDNELTEYEYDHVLIGFTNDIPTLNLDEVMEWKYIDYASLSNNIAQNPENYTFWFKHIYERVHSEMSKISNSVQF